MNRPPVYPGGRRGNNSRADAKTATTSAWQGMRLGTQGVGQTSVHHNTTYLFSATHELDPDFQYRIDEAIADGVLRDDSVERALTAE